MTHANNCVEKSLQECLDKTPALKILSEKCFGRAIAVENKVDNISFVTSNRKREQLIQAMLEHVNYNGGQTYSSSLFEETKIELKNEQGRFKIREQLCELTFRFVIDNFPSESLRKLGSGSKPSKNDAKRIVAQISDDERSLMPTKEQTKVAELYLTDHFDFIKNLLESKERYLKNVKYKEGEGSNEELPDNIFHYVRQCFKDMPHEILEDLKVNESLPQHKIDQIIKDVPFPNSHETNMLTQEYIYAMVNAYYTQHQRQQLIKTIHVKCYGVIKSYFRGKSFSERSLVINDFVLCGVVPPDLHCRCMQVIPEEFKLEQWMQIIHTVLVHTLVDRVKTEKEILQSIANIFAFAKTPLLITIFTVPIMFINPLAGLLVSYACLGINYIGSMLQIYTAWKSYTLNYCDDCKGWHIDKKFTPRK